MKWRSKNFLNRGGGALLTSESMHSRPILDLLKLVFPVNNYIGRIHNKVDCKIFEALLLSSKLG